MDLENNKLYHVFEIYDAFINYGYNVRTTCKSGYDSWHAIKKYIPEEIITWTHIAHKYYADLTTGVYSIEDVQPINLDAKGQLRWERNYFLLQHGRILKKYPTASLTKLFQIAYNTGQFIADNEIEPYPQTQLGYFVNKQLNKPSSFVEIDSLQNVSAKVYSKIYDALHSIVIGDKTALVKKINIYSDNNSENFKKAAEEKAKTDKSYYDKIEKEKNEKNEKNKKNEKNDKNEKTETSATSSDKPATVTDSETSKSTEKTTPSETSSASAPTEAAAATTSADVSKEEGKKEESKTGGANFKLHFSEYISALKKERNYR